MIFVWNCSDISFRLVRRGLRPGAVRWRWHNVPEFAAFRRYVDRKSNGKREKRTTFDALDVMCVRGARGIAPASRRRGTGFQPVNLNLLSQLIYQWKQRAFTRFRPT